MILSFFFLKKAQDLDLEKALYIFLTRVKFTNSPAFYMRIKKKKTFWTRAFLSNIGILMKIFFEQKGNGHLSMQFYPQGADK